MSYNGSIKTTVLNRAALEKILSNGNVDFLVAFNSNGEIERFVPESCDCKDSAEGIKIPADAIEDKQEINITITKVSPQATALATTCLKYCTIGSYTWCCKVG